MLLTFGGMEGKEELAGKSANIQMEQNKRVKFLNDVTDIWSSSDEKVWKLWHI